MKSHKFLSVVAILTGVCFLLLGYGCKKTQTSPQQEKFTYKIYMPVQLNRSEVYASINGDPAQPIDSTGKIYVRGNYIFLNEINKGIHVIDNSDPAHPVKKAFLKIPGNHDIAVKSNILYADMFSELLAINIDVIQHVSITSDVKNVFPNMGGWNNPDSPDVINGYYTKDTTVTRVMFPGGNCEACEFFVNSTAGVKAGPSGKAGSMARMAVMNDYIYAIAESHSLGVLSIAKPEAPVALQTVYAGFDLETIFPFEDKLFLGSAVGMFMFDVSDREHPSQLGVFSHGRACDPVIADGKFAYVTLHAGSACGGDANELHVLNVQDMMNPILVKTYPMTRPGGLGKDGDLLLVCDGDTGVKLFDATNPQQLKFVAEMACPEPYDVITGFRTAMVVAKRGIYQYDYSDLKNIRLISIIQTSPR